MQPATAGEMEIRDKDNNLVVDNGTIDYTNGNHTVTWLTLRNQPLSQATELVDPAGSPYEIKLTVSNSGGSACDTASVSITASQWTVESDWMNGYQPDTGALAGALDDAYYSVSVDPDHDSSCTYYEYLTDIGTANQIVSYLDGYEDEDADEYLMGADKYSSADALAGITYNGTFSVSFVGEITDWCNENGKTVATGLQHNAVHEICAHQQSLGDRDHCPWDRETVCGVYEKFTSYSWDNLVLCGPSEGANPDNCVHRFRTQGGG